MTEEKVINEVKKGENKNQLIKRLVIAIAVFFVFGYGYFYLMTLSSGAVNSEGLDTLVKMDEEINTELEKIFSSKDIAKDEAMAVYNLVKDYNKLFEKEAKTFIAQAKRIKVDDEKDMKVFIEKEKKIMEIAESADNCKGGRIMILAFLEETELSDKNKDRIMDVYNESCDISRLLDVVEVKRETESAGIFSFGQVPKNLADEYAEYDEEENKIIPVGYNIVSLEPSKGFVEEVELIVDGKNKGKAKVVTAEPSKGKRVKGTGDSADVANEGKKILDEILDLWKNQKMSAGDILPFLSDENQNKAQEIESNYKKIAYNWLRFEDVEVMYNQVVFSENSYNKELPFTMSLPIKARGLSDTKTVDLFFSKAKGVWVSDYQTLQNLFAIVQGQSIAYTPSQESFKYNVSDACKDSYGFKADADVKIYVNIQGYATINYTSEGGAGKWMFDLEKYTGDWKWANGNQFPLEVIDYINANKDTTIITYDFVYDTSSVKCSSDARITYTLE